MPKVRGFDQEQAPETYPRHMLLDPCGADGVGGLFKRVQCHTAPLVLSGEALGSLAARPSTQVGVRGGDRGGDTRRVAVGESDTLACSIYG